MHVPEKYRALAPPDYEAGGTSDRMVNFVDLAPTMLSLAGIAPPPWMQGQAFLGPYASAPARYLHGFRGRMDERYDLVRSVRTERYVYIRNYMPHLIYGQHIDYMFQTPTTRVWKELYDQGKLKAPRTFFWERKPPEELYDLQSDPDEVHNLVGDPAHGAALEKLRRAQREQVLGVRDVGFLSEAEMHRRAAAAGTTIYELARDAQRYPLERILDMADLASSLRGEADSQLQDGLHDPDGGVRYWAALGLLMRGSDAVSSARGRLRDSLSDESPSVRVVAAWALGAFGDEREVALALETLRNSAPPDRNGVFVSLLALNAIDALGPKAGSLRATLETMPRKDPMAAARVGEYVPRLVEYLLR